MPSNTSSNLTATIRDQVFDVIDAGVTGLSSGQVCCLYDWIIEDLEERLNNLSCDDLPDDPDDYCDDDDILYDALPRT